MKQEADLMLTKLEGKTLQMLVELQNDKTSKDLSWSGMELGEARNKILAQNVAFNTSLKSLDLSRMNITDIDGTVLARMLYTNTSLIKLELEGNVIGASAANEFGVAL